jgi:hypothetical protein
MKVLVMSMGLAALGALGFGVGSIGAASTTAAPAPDAQPVVSTLMALTTGCSGCMASHVWTPSSGDTGWVSSCGCLVGLRFNQWFEANGACFGTQPNCNFEPCHFRSDVEYESTCSNALFTATECGVLVASSQLPSTTVWTFAHSMSQNVNCGERCNLVYTIAQKSGSLVCVDHATLSARIACTLCQ